MWYCASLTAPSLGKEMSASGTLEAAQFTAKIDARPNRWHGVAGWSRRMQWLDVSRDPKIGDGTSSVWIALQARLARLDARTAQLFVDLGLLRIDVR